LIPKTSRRRIKLELTNDEGDRLILIMEGRIDRGKIMQLADFLELYGGGDQRSETYAFENSKISKLMRIISKYFSLSFFSSREVLEAYIMEYREPMSLSTVSTYLARLADRGILERHGSGNNLRYRLSTKYVNRVNLEDSFQEEPSNTFIQP